MPLTNSQYQVIMRDYNRIQAKNKRDQDRRREEIYRKIPQIRALDEELVTLSMTQARKLLNGDKEALAKLREQIDDIKEQKTILLLGAGYEADSMEMRYQCPDCQDTGYVGNQRCHCFKQKIMDLLYEQSNLKEILKRENFETFDDSYFDREPGEGGRPSPYDNIKRVVRLCRGMIEGIHQKPMNLLLTGSAGTGKTFLTHCIAKELVERCVSVIYLSADEFFSVLAKSKFDYPDEGADKGHYIMDCDMLVIDDLGTELNNTLTNSQLFGCINERLLRGKSTIISTNLSLNLLRDYYTERVTSRIISSYQICELYGSDIRIKKVLRNS